MSKNNVIIGSICGDGNILIGTKFSGIITTTTTTSTTTTAAPTTTTTTTAAGCQINILYCFGCDCNGLQCASNEGVLCSISSGCYSPTFHWCMYKPNSNVTPTTISVCITCNNFLKDSVVCTCQSCSCAWACSSGFLAPFCVNSSDVVRVLLAAEVNTGCSNANCITVYISSVAPQSGGYIVGSQNSLCSYTCGSLPTTTTNPV